MMKHPVTGKSIVRDGLVLQHNYNLSSVEPLSSGAASFDGTDDYIALGASNSLVTGTNVTLACWFQLLDTDNAYLFQNQKGSASSNIFLRLNSDGHGFIGAGVWTGSTHSIISFDGNVDTTSSWHHIAYVTTSSAQTLYLDGVAVATSTSTFANAASSDQSVLGSLNGATNFLKGYMANMGVWSAALSQAQVKSIMNKNYDSLSASEKTDLVSWWNLDETLGDKGIVLDKDGAIGENLLDNADFANGQDDWGGFGSGNTTLLNGVVTLDGTSGVAQLGQGILTNGSTYEVEFTITDHNGDASNSEIIDNGGNSLFAIPGDGVYKIHFTLAYANANMTFRAKSGSKFSISNISVKLVNGNHGTLS